MMQDRLKQAFAKAAKYCADRERAPRQVMTKLVNWGCSEKDAEAVIDSLKQTNFVNEDRFVTAFAKDKFIFNKWGKVRIRLELKKLALPEEKIEAGLEAIAESDYHDQLESVGLKKLQILRLKTSEPFVIKQKLVQYLMGKGYEPDRVWGVVNGIVG